MAKLTEAGERWFRDGEADETTDWPPEPPEPREPPADSDDDRNGSVLGNMFDGAWLDAQRFSPLEYAVPGIVPEGFGLLVSPPKAGKSWLVLDLGLACAAGGLALGRIAVPTRPVLYLALEDGQRRLQARCRYLLSNQPIPAGIEFITTVGSYLEARAIVTEFVTVNDRPLVILDTLGKVRPSRPPGADPYQFDYSVGTQLKQCVDAKPGSSLLGVHHARKAVTADFIDAVSGTSGIAGSADFVLVLARPRYSGEALLSVTGRDVREAEYALTCDDGYWELAGLTLADAASMAAERRALGNLGDVSQKILTFVNGREKTVPADLANITRDGAAYLKRLADAGRIRKVSRGVYAPVISVMSVITPGEDGSPWKPAES